MNAAPASIPPTTPRSAAMLRRIRLLPRRRLARRRLLLGGGSRLLRCGGLRGSGGLLLRRGLRLHVAQGRLEVVEDESGGRVAACRGRDDRFAGTHHEDAAFAGRHLELRQRALSRLDRLRGGEEPTGRLGELIRAGRIPERGRGDLPRVVEHDRGLDLAAMIAYFALLSFVPLTFISLALLGLTGRADESSFLVREIKKTLPGTPIDQIINLVHAVQDNAATLGIIGGLALLWTSLSLFSVLESALNIVYGRPNRSFLHGKGLAFLLMVSSLVTLFVALLAGSLGVTALQDYLPGVVSNAPTAYALSIGVSLIGVFVFLVSCYYVLTNEDDLTPWEVLPGAIFAAVLLEATFQVLPLYQRYADLNPALRAFGAPAILLVWLYVMANVIVFGAELNWWLKHRAAQRQEDEQLAGLA